MTNAPPPTTVTTVTTITTTHHHVWLEKCCMILHIRGLGEDSLARRVWSEQQLFGWPGLAREAAEISRKLVVADPKTTTMTKVAYRKEVARACHQYNEKNLKDKMRTKDGQIMTKCRKIAEDHYGRKEYFAKKVPSEVRSVFATRVSMLPLAGNFSHDRRFASTGWWCRCGEAREEEEHVRDSCPLYDDIREQFDNLSREEELIQFFQAMLKRRDAIDREGEDRKKRERQEKTLI